MFTVPASISTASAIRALASSLLALSTIAVVGRFWARSLQKTHFQADDWLMVPAWIAFVGLCACMLESTYIHTLGYTPIQAAPFHPSAHDGAIIQLTIDILLAMCLGFTKLSALLFYKRVFCAPGRRSTFRTILDLAVIAVACWTVTFIIFPLALCRDHIDGYWIRPIFNKYCPTAHPYLISGSATDVFFELLVILLPLPSIWQLQTSTRRKLAVTLIFLTALLSLGASIARLVIVVQLATQTITDAGVAALGNSAIFTMWTLEAGSGIIAINMPSLSYFRTRKAPEKILHSLRSIISLRSIRSKDSRDSGQTGAQKDAETSTAVPRGSGSDRTGSSGRQGSAAYIHAGAETLPNPRSYSNSATAVPSNNGIKVVHNVSQSVEKV